MLLTPLSENYRVGSMVGKVGRLGKVYHAEERISGTRVGVRILENNQNHSSLQELEKVKQFKKFINCNRLVFS